jgi:putative endonuclease
MTYLNKRASGHFWEEKAVEYLKSKGFQILETNFRVGKFGEIDIIAYDNEILCFIEVKSRKSDVFGTPAEAVNFKKQTTIKRLATMYSTRPEFKNRMLRFDIVEIYTTGESRINLLKNAF